MHLELKIILIISLTHLFLSVPPHCCQSEKLINNFKHLASDIFRVGEIKTQN